MGGAATSGDALVDLPTDVALLDAIATGDADAFRTLYRRHAGRVRGLAEQVTGDRGLAEDVRQEVFLEVWHRPGTYRPGAGTVSSWLLSVARHRAIDRVRTEVAHRARLHRVTETDDRATGRSGADMASDVVARLDAQRRAGSLRRALAGLPREQREVLERMYWERQSGSRIADDMGVPLGTIKSRALLGKRKLRQLVA
jgi:RNA polymerase sigma-70 factor, ECF subfamily